MMLPTTVLGGRLRASAADKAQLRELDPPPLLGAKRKTAAMTSKTRRRFLMSAAAFGGAALMSWPAANA